MSKPNLESILYLCNFINKCVASSPMERISLKALHEEQLSLFGLSKEESEFLVGGMILSGELRINQKGKLVINKEREGRKIWVVTRQSNLGDKTCLLGRGWSKKEAWVNTFGKDHNSPENKLRKTACSLFQVTSDEFNKM